jgi:hypothetical protein
VIDISSSIAVGLLLAKALDPQAHAPSDSRSKRPQEIVDARPTKKAQNASRPMERGRSLPTATADAIDAGRGSLQNRRSRFLCPDGMVMIGHQYCIDVYEASLVIAAGGDDEQAWSPFVAPPKDGSVKLRAVSVPGVYPQGYISGIQAQEACQLSGKRLCKPDEWKKACMGPRETTYPYGNQNEPKRCNDTGKSPMEFFYNLSDSPEDRIKWGLGGNMMDPRLNQLEGGLAPTGQFSDCTNEYGVHDMVGNLHEWIDDPWGTFQGGYYLDTHLNEDGCYYRTTAHAFSHADYSTGFRCCADVDSL